jgi:hypothetical protein
MKTQTRKYKLKNRKTKRGGFSTNPAPVNTTQNPKPAATNTAQAATNTAATVQKGFFNGWFKSKDTFNVDANKSIDNMKKVFKTKDIIINDNMTITEIKNLIPPVSA